jgi:hypothetical protein
MIIAHAKMDGLIIIHQLVKNVHIPVQTVLELQITVLHARYQQIELELVIVPAMQAIMKLGITQ